MFKTPFWIPIQQWISSFCISSKMMEDLTGPTSLNKSWTKWRKSAVSTYLESVRAPPFILCAQGNRITQKKKPRTTFLLIFQNQPLQLSSDALIKGHPWYSHHKNLQLYYESAGSRHGWVVHLFAARGLCWFGIAFMLDPGPCIMWILFRY